MIAAHHLIWTNYGYWLPNDPRGSMSKSIRGKRIESLGDIHYGRKRVQPAGYEIGQFRKLAAEQLKHDVRIFNDAEIVVLGESIGRTIAERNYTCYACAVMPDHVHLLVRRHRDNGDVMIAQFQEASRSALFSHSAIPKSHPVWGGKGWVVYLETAENIRRVARYVEENPIKARRPAQSWPFVKAYDGWLPGLRSNLPAKTQARRRRET